MRCFKCTEAALGIAAYCPVVRQLRCGCILYVTGYPVVFGYGGRGPVRQSFSVVKARIPNDENACRAIRETASGPHRSFDSFQRDLLCKYRRRACLTPGMSIVTRRCGSVSGGHCGAAGLVGVRTGPTPYGPSWWVSPMPHCQTNTAVKCLSHAQCVHVPWQARIWSV